MIYLFENDEQEKPFSIEQGESLRCMNVERSARLTGICSDIIPRCAFGPLP